MCTIFLTDQCNQNFSFGGVGADIWNADCNRSLIAMLSLGKLLFFKHERTQFSYNFAATSGRGAPPDVSRQQGEKTPSAGGRIASFSKIGGWTSFELFGIQSGDKNTLAR